MRCSATSGEELEYGTIALEFVDRLSSMTSKEEIIDATRSTLGQFGFERFVMSTMPSDSDPRLPHVLLLDLPRGWAEHYLANAYQKIDPVVRACRATTNPFCWNEIAVGRQATNPTTEVMHRAQDFGMSFGLTLPIHGLNGQTSCFSMSSRQQPFVNQFSRPAIHLMGIYAFDRASELDQPTNCAASPLLSGREREVLTWSAVGKTASAIADILMITERTVIAHSMSAMHKLGAANKTEAVARALQQRLISP